MGGPIATASAGGSELSQSSFKGSVTRHFLPYEPSSVTTITSSAAARISFSKINRSFVRAPMIATTLLPAALCAFTIGYKGATPIPPPTHTTVPTFSICVGLPSGPRIASMESPTSFSASLCVVEPTVWNTSAIHPSSAFASAIVSGIRSP